MKASPSPDYRALFAGLTHAQEIAMGLLAFGLRYGEDTRAMRALVAKGLARPHGWVGGAGVPIARTYMVPEQVLEAWGAWCIETLGRQNRAAGGTR